VIQAFQAFSLLFGTAARTTSFGVAPHIVDCCCSSVPAFQVGYTPFAIPSELCEPLGWMTLPKDAKVWLFVPNSPVEGGEPGTGLSPASYTHPILQTYVDICILGVYFAEAALRMSSTVDPARKLTSPLPTAPQVASNTAASSQSSS